MTTGEDMDRLAARHAAAPATMPPEVRKALIKVLDYVGPDEKADWDHSGRSESHIWPAIRAVWDWLSVSSSGGADR